MSLKYAGNCFIPTDNSSVGYGIHIGSSKTVTLSLAGTKACILSSTTAYPASQWGNSANHFVVAAAAPRNELGSAGYFQTDVSGTVAGTLYNFGSWINMQTSSVGGSNTICAQDNGIWSATITPVASAKLVIGMRMECVIDDGGDPGSLYLFSTNIYANVCTALFDVNDKTELGWITGVLSGGGGCHIPLFKERGTTTFYVNCYTS
jgi:hypothetical protein